MTDCNCELLNIIDEEAFNTKAIRELCSIANRSEDTTFLRMVDQTSEGDVQFVRTSVGDFLLDGVTSYTPIGEVKPYKRTTSEEWVEIEKCRFDGNTYVDTGYLIEQGGVIEATWAIPNYAYSSSNRYFCGAIKGTASTAGADRWYALYNSGISSNKRKSSYRGSSLANIIEADYPNYTHNKKARFRRTNTFFSCYQEVDGVDTLIFSTAAPGSNIKAEIPCYIGAVNLNGTPTAGYSTAYNLWFYEFEHFDDDDGTYVDIVPVKNTATGVIALKDKIAGTIMLPQKINTTLDYGGVLYETPRAASMMLMSKGLLELEELEEFDEPNNNEEEEE